MMQNPFYDDAPSGASIGTTSPNVMRVTIIIV